MTLTFTARIDGAEIHCDIGSDSAISAPVFCFSLMAAPEVVAGGRLIRTLAGYGEVLLPDLAPGVPHRLVLRHANRDYSPRNRAWLPLGAYLRTQGGCLPLPVLPAGVQAFAPAPAPDDFAGLPLIPQPSEWLPAGGTVAATGFRTEAARFRAVDALAERLHFGRFSDDSGLPLTVREVSALADWAYSIEIGAAGVVIETGSSAGLFAAAVTLLSLVQTTGGQLPLGRIIDEPRFAWRGQHLDCARHFYRVETILRLLDLMALMKLNRFHWHFSDDEAFRLQVESCPDLWRGTEQRGEGCAVPGVFGGGIRSGGSYSPTDVEAVLARARELHIEVLPEIEVPAHAFGVNAVVPGLVDPADPRAEVSIQGYPRNIMNPAVASTWAFLEPLALEVASLFPMGMLHLGGDELPPNAWAESPAVAALKRQMGLTTQEDVQGHTMERLARFMAGHGIRTAAWEEASRGCQGGIGHNALIFSWTGQGPGLAAARAGHDVVMCPAQHVYFDMAHSSDPRDWGAAWAAFVGLEDVIAWKPVPQGAEDVAHRIVGVQGCFWSEFTTEDRQMEPMLAPRILGLANKAWDVHDALTGPGLRALAARYAALFDRMGWQRHTGA
jgi:hexosaminidase